MLSNVLGIAIAFVTVILLLSMVVTGFVQATQAVLRLRARNLQQGIAALLRKYSDDTLSRPESRRKAAGVLNSDLATVGRVLKGDSPLHRILGPKVSWADPAEIAAAVTSLASDAAAVPAANAPAVPAANAPAVPAANAPAAPAAEAVATPPDSARVEWARRRDKAWLTEEVKRMEPAMSKRFLLVIRLWTIVWSLVIATLFQVSTPALLSSFTSGTRPTASAEKGAAEAEETARQQQSVAAASESAEEQLKAYGIRFWGDKTYYVNKGQVHWGAIVGVLMTGILMSFGAPFWFNRLRDLASLRDVKAPLPTPDK